MDSIVRVGREKFKLERGKDLSCCSFFQTRGKAEYYAEPASTEDLSVCLEMAYKHGIPVSVMGDGTHVIISDEGVDGLLISTRRMKGMTIKGNLITAYSGESLSDVINTGIDHHLIGLEKLGGIPGTIAAALKINASSQGKSISEYHYYSDYMSLDGKLHRKPDYKDLFGYRSSIIKDDEIVLSVTLRLEPSRRTAEARVRKEGYVTLQFIPPTKNFVGEVFKDPEGYKARNLIKLCGLTGDLGFKAEFSHFESNCIFMEDGCPASEVVALIRHVQTEVMRKMGIRLETQVSFLGKFQDI